jgi:pyruvate formate lyase activating enzyme
MNKGKCKARENRDGKYFSLVYNTPCLIHLDKIEKLPIYHMLPGTNVFSIATAGCNLSCKYCQNWQFSQKSPYETQNYKLTPSEVVKKAKEAKCSTIAYFYTEPVIYFEYMYDIAKLAKKENMKNIMVSAGYINEDPLKEVAPYIDAVTFGLKGFSNKYYNEVIGGELEYVQNTLLRLEKLNIWYEIVNLIVPTLNDNLSDIKRMCEWIKTNLSVTKPIHFTRFVPEYQLRDLPFTPQSTLEKARNIALETGLSYVYTGNMPGHEGNNTYCPGCKKLLIQRIGIKLINNYIKNGKCPFCGTKQMGNWV